MNKKAIRQHAMKKDKQKKRIIAAICFTVILLLIIAQIINVYQRRGTRVYANGRFTVTLNRDGTFEASLPHGVTRSGRFSEVADGNTTIVSFGQEGVAEVNGVINGDVLTIPIEWDDGHRHPRDYTLRR